MPPEQILPAHDGRPPSRAREESLTLSQYLEAVRTRPALADNAHQRLWRMIAAAGERDGEGRPYPFFCDHLYGIEATIRRLVDEYFRPAAAGFDVRRRILLLVGPVSGGKSTLVTLLKRGLERWSARDEGAVYAIAGCPMHEDPLHLVPESLREAVGQEIGRPIEGELCPLCQWRLETVFGGDREAMGIRRVHLSESHRIGIGSYAPSDPKSQDVSDLTGSVDFAAIGEVGSESDPRAFRFDGELNVANRGLVEFQEMLKLDERFLYHLLSLSQEGNFKTGRYQLISADEVVIGHTNPEEYRTFKENPRNQALLSRMLVVPVPYPLTVRDEARIYAKLIDPGRRPGVHLGPAALTAAARVAVVSRLRDEPKPEGDRLSRLRQVEAGAIQPNPDEGYFGLDPRYLVNRLAALVATAEGCVDPFDVLAAILAGVEHDPFADSTQTEAIRTSVGLVEAIVRDEILADVRRAFLAEGEAEVEALFENYCDHLVRCVRGQSADEALLSDVESRLGVSRLQAAQFREEIYLAWEDAREAGGGAYFKMGRGLREALEAKLFDDLADEIRLSPSRQPDPPSLAWVERAMAAMVASGRYCPDCAGKALRRVGEGIGR